MLTQMLQHLSNLRRETDGVTAIEYGLLAALIAVAIIAAVIAVGTGLTNTFAAVSTGLNTAAGS